MNNIKTLRGFLDITIRELGDDVLIAHSAISLIENGKQPLRQIHIDKLTAYFNVTSDYLLGKSKSGILVYCEDGYKEISEDKYRELKNSGHITERRRFNEAYDYYFCETGEQPKDIPHHFIFRETDLSLKEILGIGETFQTLNGIISSLTEDQAKKVLKFIQDYII